MSDWSELEACAGAWYALAMSKEITIDAERCNGCGICLQTCVLGNFAQGDDGKVQPAEGLFCFACGHCIAACHTGAMAHSVLDSSEFELLDESVRPTFGEFLKFLKMRRSRREFKPDPVPKSEIEKLLLAAVQAPSAINNQSMQYTAVCDPDRIRGISSRAAIAIKKVSRMMRNPLLKGLFRLLARATYDDVMQFLPLMELITELQARGKDMILYDAPCVILLHAPKSDTCAPMDANFSAENILLAAETLGLGACVVGFVYEPMNKDPEMKRLAGIPKDHKVYSAIALGYPRFRYRAAPPKNPPIIHYVGPV